MMEEVSQADESEIIAAPTSQVQAEILQSPSPPHTSNTPVAVATTVQSQASYPPQGHQPSVAVPPPVMHNAPLASTVVVPDVPEYSDVLQNENDNNTSGMWGWIKSASQNPFVQSVVEKTKTGMDRMITTLDPGMTPYLRIGGDINIVVASEKEIKWGAVRDAFQKVFGLAHVQGMPAQSGVAPQPVGYSSGLRGAQDRINYLRRSGLIDEKQLCVSIESFVAEVLPDKWFDIGCVILEDPIRNINLEVFTQAVPVPMDIISHIQSATPADYSLSWSGLSVTTGQAFLHQMPWIEPSDWHKTLTGQSRRSMIYDAVLTLAGLYKERLPKNSPGEPI